MTSLSPEPGVHTPVYTGDCLGGNTLSFISSSCKSIAVEDKIWLPAKPFSCPSGFQILIPCLPCTREWQWIDAYWESWDHMTYFGLATKPCPWDRPYILHEAGSTGLLELGSITIEGLSHKPWCRGERLERESNQPWGYADEKQGFILWNFEIWGSIYYYEIV